MQKGPQEITLHGEPVVIVLSKKDYDQLTKPKLSFVQFIRKSPLVGIHLKIQRDSSSTRDTD